jgi:tetratricopeptide (TPR) repeat protein
MDIFIGMNRKSHPDMSKLLNTKGLCHKGLKDFDEAIKCYEESLSILAKNFPKDHFRLAPQYNNLGVIYKKMGEYNPALKYYFRCYDNLRKNRTITHPLIGDITYNIGIITQECCEGVGSGQVYIKSKMNYSRTMGNSHEFVRKCNR